MQAELIYNAHAGRSIIRNELHFATDYLEEHGWTVTVCETQAPLEATELARRAAAREVDVVIAVGGDGTVNEVISGLVNTETALGVIPVGTTNVWALQMRIPAFNPMGPGPGLAKLKADFESRTDYTLPISAYRPVLLAAAQALVEGRTHAVDVGQVAQRYFLLWAGVGLDAAITATVSPEDKKALGPWAFVGTALDVVREYHSTEITLVLDGNTEKVDASLIIASNIQLYGGMIPLGTRAHIDDGKLDVCVFKGEGLFNFVQHIIKVAAGQHLHDPQIAYYQAKEIIVKAAKPLPVHADDEPFTETPVTIRAIPKALKVILPQNVPPGLFTGDSANHST